MAKGRPGSWAKMKVHEEIWLGKRGLEIQVWDKYGRSLKGTLTIAIGGIKWYGWKKQHANRLISWDKIAKL